MKKIMLKWRHRKNKLRKHFERKKTMSGVNIITKHAPWISYRTVSSTEPALGNTEKKGTNVTNQVYYVIPEAMNNVEARISCTSDTAGKTGVAYFYGARWLDKKSQQFDDISLIGSVAIISGEQVSSANYKYVHSMILTDRWITEVKVADGNANNGMSRLAFDASGYDVMFVRVADASMSGYSWIIDISGW